MRAGVEQLFRCPDVGAKAFQLRAAIAGQYNAAMRIKYRTNRKKLAMGVFAYLQLHGQGG